MPEKASPMEISQLRLRVMAYFLMFLRQDRDTTHHRLDGQSRASLAEHPHDGLGVAVDDG